MDVLIGTHRLLSRDVRARDLGLLIVDEEQRFGVRQKDLLRQLKLRVDVLSSRRADSPYAPDEPRGAAGHLGDRDPPEGRRPIQTYVGPYDEELVAGDQREAAAGARCSSSTTGSTRSTRWPSGSGRSARRRYAEAHGQMD